MVLVQTSFPLCPVKTEHEKKDTDETHFQPLPQLQFPHCALPSLTVLNLSQRVFPLLIFRTKKDLNCYEVALCVTVVLEYG